MDPMDIEMELRPKLPSLKTTGQTTKYRRTAKQIGRAVSMRTKARPGTANIHPQSASKFFSIPIELRLDIYELVFTEKCDMQHAYKSSASYYRPGHESPPKSETSLLLVCRQISLEASDLPLNFAKHRFWFHNGLYDLDRMTHTARTALKPDADDRRVDGSRHKKTEKDRYQAFFNGLTSLNLIYINHVQVFGSCVWLRSFQQSRDFDEYFRGDLFAARMLTVTIRDSEWGAWKDTDDSSIDTAWLQAMLNSRNLCNVKKLNVELEMRLDDQEKLNCITAVLADLRGKYFKRNREVLHDQWSRALLPDALLPSSDNKVVYATRKITWEAVLPNDGIFKHARGHIIREGEIDDFRTARQRFKTKARKRGGRRSMPVWYRNHFQPRYATQAEFEYLKNEDEAAIVMEEWSDTGSLLRLI